MKRLFIVAGLFFVLAIGVGVSVTKWVPWWRVEGRDELARAQVKFNRVKLAWVLGRLGVWEKGVRGNNREWQVPERVVFEVHVTTYERDRYIDGLSGKTLYGAYDKFVDGDTLLISLGLPNIDFFGEPKKMTAILNDQVFMTMMRLVRSKPVSSPSSFETEMQLARQSLPAEVVNTMIVIK